MGWGDCTLGPSDYLLLDGQEEVTVRGQRGAIEVSVVVPNAVGLVYQEREAALSGGLFDVGDRAWHIPRAQLQLPGGGELSPREGDTVTQRDGTQWVAHGQGCNQIAFGTAYRMVCYRSKKQLPV